MPLNPNADIVFADGPLAAPYQPEKSAIRRIFKQVEQAIDAFSAGAGSIAKATKSQLGGDLAHAADVTAWVYNDPTASNNGIYRKYGGSGAGSWTRILDLPFSFIIASNPGAGTANAIQATTSIPVSSSALVILPIAATNTATPVTLSFNGGSALAIKTVSGNDPVVGGLTSGMIALGFVSGSTFRLASDQASAAIIELAQAAAEAALGAANAGFVFNDVAAFEAASVDPVIEFVRVAGYTTAGDGGAVTYVRLSSAPGTIQPWHKQTADDDWWVLSEGEPNPEMFGAVGNGTAADTTAVQNADAYAVATNVALNLSRTYLITADPAALLAPRRGAGSFKRSGRTVPAAPKEKVTNQIWGGHFAVAQEAGSFSTGAWRKQMLDGMTGARIGFSSGVVAYSDVGDHHPFGCHIQRNAGNTDASSFVGVWPLSVTESRCYRGEKSFVSFYSKKGANFSAPSGTVTLKVIGSRGALQPIIRDDGNYDLDTIELASYSWVPGNEVEPYLVPQWVSFTPPVDIQQIAFVLIVPFSGTAGADDWLKIEALHSDLGAVPTPMPDASREELIPRALTRYRASYPYGLPPGILTLPGSLAAIATSTASPNGVVFSVKWDAPMVYRPSVVPYSPIIGGNPRIGDETAGTRLFAQVFDVSETGFFITNNAATVSGNRYRAHWVARAAL